MNDNWLAKIAKNGKPNSSRPPGWPPNGLRESDINIAGGQTQWIKYMSLQEEEGEELYASIRKLDTFVQRSQSHFAVRQSASFSQQMHLETTARPVSL